MSLRLTSATKGNTIIDKPLTRGKQEINLSTFALLFSEMVQYAQNRVSTVAELQDKLTAYGYFVGSKLLDAIIIREKGYKREKKLLDMLLLLRTQIWRNLFNKDADKLERSNDDPTTYFIIEKDPLVNSFISVPKDKASLNCAAFIGGIVEAILNGSNFPCKVTVHWHNGTTYMIKFDDAVLQRAEKIG